MKTIKTMKTMRIVNKEDFYSFLAAYPRQLVRDVCGIGDPPLATYNDFTLGVWPESIVARYRLGRGPGDEVGGYAVLEGCHGAV